MAARRDVLTGKKTWRVVTDRCARPQRHGLADHAGAGVQAQPWREPVLQRLGHPGAESVVTQIYPDYLRPADPATVRAAFHVPDAEQDGRTRWTRPGGQPALPFRGDDQLWAPIWRRCAVLREFAVAILPLIMTDQGSSREPRPTSATRSSSRVALTRPGLYSQSAGLSGRGRCSHRDGGGGRERSVPCRPGQLVSPWAANPFMLKPAWRDLRRVSGGRDQHRGLCHLLRPSGLCHRAGLHGRRRQLQLYLPGGRHHRREPPVPADLLRVADAMARGRSLRAR